MAQAYLTNTILGAYSIQASEETIVQMVMRVLKTKLLLPSGLIRIETCASTVEAIAETPLKPGFRVILEGKGGKNLYWITKVAHRPG